MAVEDENKFLKLAMKIVMQESNETEINTKEKNDDCRESCFQVIGVTETKITNSNLEGFIPSISGYNFEYVPTPLSAEGVRMSFDASLDYVSLEKKHLLRIAKLFGSK